MNAVAVIEAAVSPAEEWIDRGRTLAAKRRDVDWAIADWMVEGKAAGHLDQAGFDFLADNLGIGPAKLKLIHKAAAIPAHLRDTSLTVEHHAHVAELPVQEQIELLTEAKRQHWSDDDLRKQTITRKVETGRAAMLSPDEWDDHCRMQLQHAWNRANPSVREDFAELIAASNMGVIDA
ncbi:hypothetical protein [Sphingobium yanoikuyae]|uniref:hypothetical protein n=1 Tax=Sphingobium yanoikuyae TaxID=13690 RepID=UPI000262C03D|nr:hypothetical protein [Sphingobium yanoikuyae]